MTAKITETTQTDKRFLVCLSFYLHAKNELKAEKQAIALAAKMNKETDCQASVNEMYEKPFGKPTGKRIL